MNHTQAEQQTAKATDTTRINIEIQTGFNEDVKTLKGLIRQVDGERVNADQIIRDYLDLIWPQLKADIKAKKAAFVGLDEQE